MDTLVAFAPRHVPGLSSFAMERGLSALRGRNVDRNTPQFLSRHFRDQVLDEAEDHAVAA